MSNSQTEYSGLKKLFTDFQFVCDVRKPVALYPITFWRDRAFFTRPVPLDTAAAGLHRTEKSEDTAAGTAECLRFLQQVSGMKFRKCHSRPQGNQKTMPALLQYIFLTAAECPLTSCAEKQIRQRQPDLSGIRMIQDLSGFLRLPDGFFNVLLQLIACCIGMGMAAQTPDDVMRVQVMAQLAAAFHDAAGSGPDLLDVGPGQIKRSHLLQDSFIRSLIVLRQQGILEAANL